MQPVERFRTVDAVRGLALGGMLLVNLGAFTGVDQIPLSRLADLGWLARVLVLLLAEGKFYPMFAFLFGWGLARRFQRGVSYESHLRRMLVLALLGLLHALLWPGDILLVYAVLGAALPWVARLPNRWWTVLAALALLAAPLLQLPGLGQIAGQVYRDWAAPLVAHMPAGLPGGLNEFAAKLVYFPYWLGSFAALILLGYRAAKQQMAFQPPPRFLLLPALVLNLLYVVTFTHPYALPAEWVNFLRSLSLSLGGSLLAWIYAAGIVAMINADSQKDRAVGGLGARPMWARSLIDPLVCLGRMSLTVYLSQTLFALSVVRVVPPGSLASALLWPLTGVIFLIQAVLSHLWLARYRHGPVESLLLCLAKRPA